MMRVERARDPRELDHRAARRRTALRRQHEHRRAFADDKAIAMRIERARDAARAEDAEEAETREHQWIDIRTDAAAQRDVDLAEAHGAGGLDDRGAARRTRERDRLDG